MSYNRRKYWAPLTHRKRRIRKKWKIQGYTEWGFTVAGFPPPDGDTFMDALIAFVESRNLTVGGSCGRWSLNVEQPDGVIKEMFHFYVDKIDGVHVTPHPCRWATATEEDRLAVLAELERLGATHVTAGILRDTNHHVG